MTIEEKLTQKLQPHTDRINDGTNDDFDYLPAVLHHLLEQEKALLNAFTQHISPVRDDIKSGVQLIGKNIQEAKQGCQEDIKRSKEETRGDLRDAFQALGKRLDDDFLAQSNNISDGIKSVRDDVKQTSDDILKDLYAAVQIVKVDVKQSSDAIVNAIREVQTSIAQEGRKAKRFRITQLVVSIIILVVSLTALYLVRT